MFAKFKKVDFQTNGITINYAIGGQGPAVLLLHGYPQTHIMWHKIADHLADHFTVVASDLRGYGDSSKPAGDAQHHTYSKRQSSKDQVELMHRLGFDQFHLVGHDRGARVGHRMALDHPSSIKTLTLMDIAPTYTMYHATDREFAEAYYHWYFLIQPFDLPERMIGHDVAYFLSRKLGQWGRTRGAISEEAFAEYLRCFTKESIHASCEDYRASASIDLDHDQTDLDQDNKINCPVYCLWGENGFVGYKYDVLAEWSKWAADVSGHSIPCGHYLAEEAPDETLSAILNFLQ